MKGQESGFTLPSFLPRLSYEKQDTLLKLCILSIAAILCELQILITYYLFFASRMDFFFVL